MAKDNDTLNDILEAEQQVLPFFKTKWDSATRNGEMYGLQHWTVAEREAIIAQGRIPYQFDKNSHALNVLLGTQRDTRFDIFFYERRPDQAHRVELLNAVWKYYADKFDFMHVESDVFQDGIIAKYGAFECEKCVDYDPTGDLRVKRVPYDQILWDKNFREYDLSDAYWMSNMSFFRREELKRKYYKDKGVQALIDKAGLDTNWTGKESQMQYWIKPDTDLIGVRTFFERQWENRYFLWMKGNQEPEPKAYDTKKDAEKEIARRVQLVMAAQSMGQYPPGAPMPEWEVMPIPVKVMKKTVAVIDGLLEETATHPMGDFPYTIYFSNFYDGEFWSTQDRLKDPQIFINRMYSQLDHWIGTMSKGLLVGDSRIPENEWKKITEMFGKTGGAVRTKYAKDMQILESKGPAPQLFSLLDRAENSMDDSMGGANALGLKQSSSESGRAVLARQSQAGMDTFNTLDNMRRTKQNLGVKIAWYLTNEITEPKRMRIVGDAQQMQQMAQRGTVTPQEGRPNVGYAEVNTSEDNSLEGLEVDIIVDEAAHSPTKNQAVIAALVDAGKAGILTVPPPPSVIINLLPIPDSLKQEWLQAAAQASQTQKEPPAKPANINYKDMPPQAQAAALQSLGLPATPQETGARTIIDKPHLTAQEAQAQNGAA